MRTSFPVYELRWFLKILGRRPNTYCQIFCITKPYDNCAMIWIITQFTYVSHYLLSPLPSLYTSWVSKESKHGLITFLCVIKTANEIDIWNLIIHIILVLQPSCINFMLDIFINHFTFEKTLHHFCIYCHVLWTNKLSCTCYFLFCQHTN